MLREYRFPHLREHQRFRWRLRAKALGLVEILRQEAQERARLALDVAEAGEGLIVARRGMAVEAGPAEAHERQAVGGRGRIIHTPAAVGPAIPAPEPAVLGRSAVAHHHRRTLLHRFQLQQVGHATGGRRGRIIHLLDHDRTIRHRRDLGRHSPALGRAVLLQPCHHLRRVPDQHRHVGGLLRTTPGAVAKRGDEGAGIAHRLVHLPARREAAMAVVADEIVEFRLVLVQRQGTGLAHDRVQRSAERGIGRGQLLSRLFVRAKLGSGGCCRHQRGCQNGRGQMPRTTPVQHGPIPPNTTRLRDHPERNRYNRTVSVPSREGRGKKRDRNYDLRFEGIPGIRCDRTPRLAYAGYRATAVRHPKACPFGMCARPNGAPSDAEPSRCGFLIRIGQDRSLQRSLNHLLTAGRLAQTIFPYGRQGCHRRLDMPEL